MLCGLCFFKRHILRVARGEGGGFFYTSATYSLAGWLPYSRGDERPARRGNMHERRKKALRPEKAP